MNFKEYKEECMRTATFDGTATEKVCMLCMGIAGEAGEVIDYLKKVRFHGHNFDANILSNEVGDLMWYITVLLNYFHIDIEDVFAANIKKLKKRYPEGFSFKDSIERKDMEE